MPFIENAERFNLELAAFVDATAKNLPGNGCGG
jgi:hypothetical protein